MLGWDDIAALRATPGYSSTPLIAAARTNFLDTWLLNYQQAVGRDASDDDYLGSYVSVDVERDGTGTITHKPKGTGVRTNPQGQQVQGMVYQQDTNGAWNKPTYFGWSPAALTGNMGELKLRVLNTLEPMQPLTQLLISAPQPQNNVSVRPDPQRVFIDAKRGGATQTLGPWLLNGIDNQSLLLDFGLSNIVADELFIYFDQTAVGARIDFTAGWLHLGYS